MNHYKMADMPCYRNLVELVVKSCTPAMFDCWKLETLITTNLSSQKIINIGLVITNFLF